jgi:hypothetical protein
VGQRPCTPSRGPGVVGASFVLTSWCLLVTDSGHKMAFSTGQLERLKYSNLLRIIQLQTVAYPGFFFFWGGVYTRNFFSGNGVQQTKLRIEGREWGSGGGSPPSEGFHSICK